MSTIDINASNDTIDCELCLSFIDSVGKPISNLLVELLTEGSSASLVTDSDGRLPVVSFGPEPIKGTVQATVPTGNKEEVLQFDL